MHNEYAAVSVCVDHTANGPRLRLKDHRGGRVRYLDPLQLESLVWAEDERLCTLLDPGHRWGSET